MLTVSTSNAAFKKKKCEAHSLHIRSVVSTAQEVENQGSSKKEAVTLVQQKSKEKSHEQLQYAFP